MPSHPKPPNSPRIMSQANMAGVKMGRSSSRMSTVSRGSSEEDQSKTAVRVGMKSFSPLEFSFFSRRYQTFY